MYLKRHKEQGDSGHQNTYAQPARHASTDKTGNNDVRRYRRDQQFFNVALKLGAEK
ncbi:hypothetical protein D3C81_2041460 [compost metagenome]